MTKRKIVSVLFASIMLFPCITGCGKEKVTAESLINNASKTYQETKSLDADFTFNLDFDTDVSGMFGADSDDTDDTNDSGSTTMNTSFVFDGNIQTTEDVSYLSGNLGFTIFGMTTDTDLEMYVDQKNNVTYLRDPESDNWIKEDNDEDTFDYEKASEFYHSELIENIALTNADDENSETYDVTGTISYDNLYKLMGDSTEDISLDLSDSMDTEDLKFQISMKFDRKSKDLKSCTISIDPFETYDGTIYNKFEITVDINNVNNVTVSIPDSIVENAVETSSSDVNDQIDSEMNVFPEDYSVEDTEGIAE